MIYAFPDYNSEWCTCTNREMIQSEIARKGESGERVNVGLHNEIAGVFE